jgi:hypothetical protein
MQACTPERLFLSLGPIGHTRHILPTLKLSFGFQSGPTLFLVVLSVRYAQLVRAHRNSNGKSATRSQIRLRRVAV